MNASIPISNLETTLTLLREMQSEPVSSNLSGHDVHDVDSSVQVLHVLSQGLQIPDALPVSLTR